MNVIVANDQTVRLTQQTADAYNIQDIAFYISKSLSFTDAYIKLVKNRSEYPFWLEESDYAINYGVYKVIFTEPVSLTSRDYDLVLCLDGIEISIGTFPMEGIDVLGAPISEGDDPSALITFNLEAAELQNEEVMINGGGVLE